MGRRGDRELSAGSPLHRRRRSDAGGCREDARYAGLHAHARSAAADPAGADRGAEAGGAEVSENPFDVAVIGGGIVGLATAMALSEPPGRRVVVLEAEDRLAAHQTGHNSGVIHSGLYYKPDSLKARTCAEGREALLRFCEERGIPHERCGKVVVATREDELPRLEELECRGRANGLAGIRRIGPEEIREKEPNASGIAGLWVPETGIVDFTRVTETYAEVVRAAGGEVRLGCRFLAARRGSEGPILETTAGEVPARMLVNCGGLQSDRIARACGIDPGVRIVPFRGEYYDVAPERAWLVRNLIYPVPDPQFPFLGVHFTRRVDGSVEAGPNAVLAFKREGYRRWDVSARDIFDYGLSLGFWRMALKHWRMGVGESYRSFSKGAFVQSLQRLMPVITSADLAPGGSGVRAQALDRRGKLVDDFHIVEGEGMVHVLNAPSPAATASIAIGRAIAARVRGSGP
ncbi:MAG: L-2-hydroxyglutarate oxidase [Planctomycetes bacterium]|nr:L-2-hydroxyglutarate oxidase [Planctomycetota bacterium]